MKFSSNKINLYLGIGYIVLAVISIFFTISPALQLGLTAGGLCFSVSLLCLAIENTLLPKEKLTDFEKLKQVGPAKSLETIRSLIYKKPKNVTAYSYVKTIGGFAFMLGFILMVALPGLPLSDSTLSRMSGFCYISSSGLLFVSFYLEEKQGEKTQKDGEEEIISYLFDQVEKEMQDDENEPDLTILDTEKNEDEPAPEEKPDETLRLEKPKPSFSEYIKNHFKKKEKAVPATPEKDMTDKILEVFNQEPIEDPQNKKAPEPKEETNKVPSSSSDGKVIKLTLKPKK